MDQIVQHLTRIARLQHSCVNSPHLEKNIGKKVIFFVLNEIWN